MSFLDKLRQYIAEAWQPVIAAGLHECELCVEKPFVCGSNLWIATESVVYIAPGMVLHYIEEHGYKPPEEFVEAVLESHPQGSTEFVKLVEKFLDGV